MLHSQYLRIEAKAGGCYATNREFIRAAHTVLSKQGKSRARREWRHDWIRSGLQQLADSRALVKHYRL